MRATWRKPILGGILVLAVLASLAYGGRTLWPATEVKQRVVPSTPLVVHIPTPMVEEPAELPESAPERLFGNVKVRPVLHEPLEEEYAVEARANVYAPAGAPTPVTKRAATGVRHERQATLLARMMQQLHSEAQRNFVRQPGFGHERMPRVVREVPREWKTPVWTSQELFTSQPPEFAGNDLAMIHRLSLNNFTITNLKTQEERAALDVANLNLKRERPWEIKSLDLVGIVMHETPVVYVSANVPKMADLAKTPTRELDIFEAEGLEELMSGKELYIRGKEGTVRVLGPVQASKTCLKCHHDSKEGEMLGAFSYTLRPGEHRGEVHGGRSGQGNLYQYQQQLQEAMRNGTGPQP